MTMDTEEKLAAAAADPRAGGDGDRTAGSRRDTLDKENMPGLTENIPPTPGTPAKTPAKQPSAPEVKAPRPKSFGVLKPEEETLLKLSQEGQLEEVRRLLSEKKKKIKIDCLDDSGTTPLEHACYKGHKELVELLLGAGADVNNNMQTQGYTPLMFAALAGKQDVVRILLRHGARTSATNNIGRTASQLAGFVGHHAVAVTISNFFTVEDLTYYTVPNGLEKEPKLPPAIAPLVHRFIMQNNLHPVKILFFIRGNPVLEEESGKILRTFDTIIDKEMKSREMNEIMAMKIHYLSCILRHVKKMSADGKSIEDMVKLFVRGRDAVGFPEYMEKFLRESIRSFPFYQTPLHTTMVHAIAKANLGGAGGSLSILEQSINGQHMAGRDGPPCETCNDNEAHKKCSGCHMVAYCNEECQKLHWPLHRKECKELAEQFVVMERRRLEEEERNRQEEAAKKRRRRWGMR
ncbi:ankyrin repeat and MYND domain-containing protein 2-like [Paramacrobiotus metropolitanus]|uniref:ankyrin repeat and MYND domain-containing protein 2-like n=1 Tax=Paramacrobiotus metropolitanus TaxID=2943436 RepID=UPI0024455F21|nr:ankyrin repeat and MYND domain-containing protein 2-like [Paramacrobiotus metropolitanus]XP_055339368.1 ankyrin repeat and MYND domain-containing protein 2-like [Paramacrobiotus metropolitanus]XP_055339369.1 ankyrin repeat and MYND domain-containing protein 2-like [Paramacrobiotus metropolitanus]